MQNKWPSPIKTYLYYCIFGTSWIFLYDITTFSFDIGIHDKYYYIIIKTVAFIILSVFVGILSWYFENLDPSEVTQEIRKFFSKILNRTCHRSYFFLKDPIAKHRATLTIGTEHYYGKITDPKHQRYKEENKVLSYNSLFQIFRRANNETLHADDELSFLKNICAVLTFDPRFQFTWATFAHHHQDHELVFIAPSGHKDFKKRLKYDPEFIRHAKSIAINVIQSQKLQITDFDVATSVLKDDIRRQILLAVPIKVNGKTVGALNTLSTLPHGPDQAAYSMLISIGNSIGFTLQNLWHRQKYKDLEQHNSHLERKLDNALVGAVKALSFTVELRDPYTAGHQSRVAELAFAIGQDLQLTRDQLQDLYLGALLHDLGKIRVPVEILTRPSRLSEEEHALIRPHPLYGAKIARHAELPDRVINIIEQHHERLDGSGYPKGLAGGAISIEARIVAVADSVEAISSHRPYRPALGTEVALEFISKEAGKSLDKSVVESCIRVFKMKKFAFPTNFNNV